MSTILCIIGGFGIGFGLAVCGINVIDNPLKFLALDIPLVLLWTIFCVWLTS